MYGDILEYMEIDIYIYIEYWDIYYWDIIGIYWDIYIYIGIYGDIFRYMDIYIYIEYPPTPAFAKAGAAPGTTGGVEPALSRPWPSHCPRLPPRPVAVWP